MNLNLKNRVNKIKISLDYFLPLFVKQIFRDIVYFIIYPNVRRRGRARLSLSLTFGNNVSLGESCIISGVCEIGDYTFINDFTRIDSSVGAIGRFCSISHNVKIGLRPHPVNFLSSHSFFYSSLKNATNESFFDDYQKGTTEIGHDVFIAANAIILSGVKIGNGAVISAGAIVTKDVPPYAIVAGVPSQIIRYRFDKSTIDKLQVLCWWDFPIEKLSQFGGSINNIDEILAKYS